MKTTLQKTILTLLFISTFTVTQAQTTESPKTDYHFSGSISATNNGISLIPTFSLGKPAAILNMSIGGEKLSFEPELRTSLEAKPWSIILWWRYKLLNDDKFKFTVGGHPALTFKSVITDVAGIQTTTIQAQRYLAGELTSNYYLSKDISVGCYYLYSHGIESNATQNTHFLTLNSSFSNIKLSEELAMRFSPQVYYLKMDSKDGFFVSSSLTLSKKNSPISISGLINKVIKTDIATKNFVWNATIAYSFNNKFSKQ
ncbi:hypothetical protein [Flavobacterium sp.]|uniref:hypothetical protein n=1 Tax=Flavobacterium sp. TaxID=239 RepID=UPI0037ADDF9D